MDPRYRFDDLTELLETVADDVAGRIKVAIPVQVVEDSNGHTVKLQPLVKATRKKPDGSLEQIDWPVLDEVPINHHGGGGTTVTHAHKAKDEGFIIVSDRAIRKWFAEGGLQTQTEARKHHISDSVYVPGVRNDPRKLDPAPNRRASETRSDDGKVRRTTDPEKGHSDTVKNGAHGVTLDGQTGELKATAKSLALRSGETTPGGQPDTGNATDLNDIQRGFAARIAHMEKTTAALHSAMSQMREIAQGRVPELAALAGLLNGAPSGLTATVAAVESKALAYLQTQVQQALSLFLNPNLGALTSLLGGGQEALIAAARAQIEQLIAQNPIVGVIDDLRRQSDQLAAGGVPNAAILAKIATLVAQNPVAATVQDLRARIASLTSQAGPGIGFLGPQQRAAKGEIRSVTLSGG